MSRLSLNSLTHTIILKNIPSFILNISPLISAEACEKSSRWLWKESCVSTGCNEQFLLFPQCFLLNQIIVSPVVHIFEILSLFAAESQEPKIGISGKGLNPNTTKQQLFSSIFKIRK